MPLGERRETKYDAITLQFFWSLSCCQIAVPSAERSAQCSTEQLHLPQSVIGLLSLPEVAVMPSSPAESCAIELDMFSSTPLNSKGQLYVYEISNIRELEMAKLIFAFVNTGIVDIYVDLDGLSCSLKSKHSL